MGLTITFQKFVTTQDS